MTQYVYVMSCPSLPHLVKIGFSKDCEQRLADFTSGLPTPFKLEKNWEVNNARNLEKTIHNQLSLCRISTNREFFGISAKKAIDIIDSIIKTGVFENENFNKNTVSARRIFDSSSVGKLIRHERIRQKITQKQLAFVCNTGLRVIGEIENGKYTAQSGIIFKILDLLRIEMFCVPSL